MAKRKTAQIVGLLFLTTSILSLLTAIVLTAGLAANGGFKEGSVGFTLGMNLALRVVTGTIFLIGSVLLLRDAKGARS